MTTTTLNPRDALREILADRIRYGVTGHLGGRDIRDFHLANDSDVSIDLPRGEYFLDDWQKISVTLDNVNVEARLTSLVYGEGLTLVFEIAEVD